MPNKTVKHLIEEFALFKKLLDDHLVESVTIKTRLATIEANSQWLKWILGMILIAIFGLWLKR